MNRQQNIPVAFFFLLSSPFILNSQFYHLPNAYQFSVSDQKTLALMDSSIHPGMQPYIPFFSKKYVHSDISTARQIPAGKRGLRKAAFYEHLITAGSENEDFRLNIDPLLNLEYGNDMADTSGRRPYTNTRGFTGSGHIGSRFYFETLFSENQSVFPSYLMNYANTTMVVPGQGRWKRFKTSGFDYAFATGFISVQLHPNINFQAGHGKHKTGNGYRSLLLSDNAFNYGYARLSQQWFKGRLQYTNIYASLMNLRPASKNITPNTERLFQKKAASFQYLSLNLHKRVNISLFQGMIWRAGDEKNRRQTDWQYFNPVIYANLPVYGLHNQNNLLIGGDLLLKISERVSLYGQLMADNLENVSGSAAGTGYQAGIKIFDVLRIKNLFLQMEYNQTSAGAYLSPVAGSDQSYSHYNQNLAFTPGNGTEFIFIIDYKVRRFFVFAKYHYQETGSGVQGYSYNNIVNANLGVLVNPAYNLNLSLGVNQRTQNISTFSQLNHRANYFYLALRSSIYNLYYDF